MNPLKKSVIWSVIQIKSSFIIYLRNTPGNYLEIFEKDKFNITTKKYDLPTEMEKPFAV